MRISRRALGLGVAGAAGAGALAWLGAARRDGGPAGVPGLSLPAPEPERRLGVPGPYPGRVVDVAHPAAVRAGQRDRGIVRAMLARGMKELVGSDDAVEAWRTFVSPGERVGVKVVPNGYPLAMTSTELLLEVIEALRSAGVRPGDILVFDRYLDEFLECDYVASLPDGVRWECSSAPETTQIDLDGQDPSGASRDARVSGYDPEIFRELPYWEPEHHPADDRRLRSHVSMIASRGVDKIISLPVLKDHNAAGVTAALKNLSHGLSNNVARSHVIPETRVDTFIPAIVSLPRIRERAVLHIVDALVAVYEGGPKPKGAHFATWERGALLFGTDPVAIDRIALALIDAKRAEQRLPPIATLGLDEEARRFVNGVWMKEMFRRRRPQYIEIAGAMGLGISDLHRIDHARVVMG